MTGPVAAPVWAAGVARTATGALAVNGHDVRDLAQQFGTPLYVLDETDFRSRARAFRRAFTDGDVHYAAKAFICVAVARWVEQEGLGLDVASGGELAVALAAGFPPERIVLHGNNKSDAELERALQVGVGRIVVDSFDEIDRLVALAGSLARRPAVCIRLTVGVEAHTHEFIATAHEDQKFGFSVASGSALRAAETVLATEVLDLVGVHSHIGSQIFDTSGFEVAATRAVGLLAQLRDRRGVTLGELNLGGGLGIAYVAGDDPADAAEVAGSLHDIVRRACAAHDLPVPRIAVEPGRAIAGPSTLTLYEVGTVKPVELDGGLVRHYVSVDGGMSDNVRSALYGADYTVALANRSSSAPNMQARVVGKHCESGDIVVRDADLPGDLRPGDLLAVAATGAYCRSMASTYNFVGRPPVVAVSAAHGDSATPTVPPTVPPTLILRRETEADLLALDPGVGR
jgi:diaminopimelate decarboxylase